MLNQDVYRFHNSIDYLLFVLEKKKLRNPKFSLRAWSIQLDYKNPAFLSQILSRKRKLKFDLVKRISKNLAHSTEEAKYFETLVLLENVKTAEEKNLIHDILISLKDTSSTPSIPINLDVFKFVSDWYHMAILEILNLKNFDGTQEFIENYLAKLLPQSQVRGAIERLIRLELMYKKKGKYLRSKDSPLLLDVYIPSEAVRSFHTQMIQKALDSIENQNIEQRDLRASTLCFGKSEYVKAKQLIAELHAKLALLSRDHDGETIYQMNTQIFELIPTESKGLN